MICAPEIVVDVAEMIIVVTKAVVVSMKVGTATTPPALINILLDAATVALTVDLPTVAGMVGGRMTVKTTLAAALEVEITAVINTEAMSLVDHVVVRMEAPETMVEAGMGKNLAVEAKIAMGKSDPKSDIGRQRRQRPPLLLPPELLAEDGELM
mmetsp:Transcript_6730/g.12196  ORF Transcript_6730/g.12196 Transcript_6730/m.12196 type:complete len:154 (+) Transcript_6730:25-486(+)